VHITVTFLIEEQEFDVRLDDRQKPDTILRLLQEKGLCRTGSQPAFFRSMMHDRIISAYASLREGQIQNGDQLTAILHPPHPNNNPAGATAPDRPHANGTQQ
jgi:uncharacterized ubiquitin-like protein YukD